MADNKIDLNALERANLGKVVRPEDWSALLKYARALEAENAALSKAATATEQVATCELCDGNDKDCWLCDGVGSYKLPKKNGDGQ